MDNVPQSTTGLFCDWCRWCWDVLWWTEYGICFSLQHDHYMFLISSLSVCDAWCLFVLKGMFSSRGPMMNGTPLCTRCSPQLGEKTSHTQITFEKLCWVHTKRFFKSYKIFKMWETTNMRTKNPSLNRFVTIICGVHRCDKDSTPHTNRFSARVRTVNKVHILEQRMYTGNNI